MLEEVRQDYAERAEIPLGVEMQNQGFVKIENKLVTVGFDTFTMKIYPFHKNTRNPSYSRPKTIKKVYVHSFCPHCGVKLDSNE
jgi:hypothetical protein